MSEVKVTVAVKAVDRVVVVVPLVLSWAMAEPAARTVKKMLEICILKMCVVSVFDFDDRVVGPF